MGMFHAALMENTIKRFFVVIKATQKSQHVQNSSEFRTFETGKKNSS